MFTGIIEELGTIAALWVSPEGGRVTIRCAKVIEDLIDGGSIAVNGVCLTAVRRTPDSFGCDLAPETLSRSNLGTLAAGSRVNLERPLLPGSRLSGHFVQGHVDGTAEFLDFRELGGGNWWLRVKLPADLLHYFVFKGSIAIDGISLTIAELKDDVVSVAIIPHTYRETNLHTRTPGDRLNVECDVIAKHVARLFEQLDTKR